MGTCTPLGLFFIKAHCACELYEANFAPAYNLTSAALTEKKKNITFSLSLLKKRNSIFVGGITQDNVSTKNFFLQGSSELVSN